MDGRCCRYLHVEYAALAEHVLKGGTDEDALKWCFEKGRTLTEEEIAIWNGFQIKRGWNDEASALLQDYKRRSGFPDRADIQTFFDYFELDEKRKT